jgi:flagellar hook-basal body complex protein FliE
MPDVSFSSAIAAYRASARHAGDIVPHETHADKAGAAAGPDSSFAGMVRDTLKTSVQTLEQSERMSMQGVAGLADTRDVVLAVNSAEVTLQTMVAIRDKVVSAYDTIMRMPL